MLRHLFWHFYLRKFNTLFIKTLWLNVGFSSHKRKYRTTTEYTNKIQRIKSTKIISADISRIFQLMFVLFCMRTYILVIFIDTKLQQVEKQISKKKLLMSIEKLVLYRIHSSQAAVGWFLPEWMNIHVLTINN